MQAKTKKKEKQLKFRKTFGIEEEDFTDPSDADEFDDSSVDSEESDWAVCVLKQFH